MAYHEISDTIVHDTTTINRFLYDEAFYYDRELLDTSEVSDDYGLWDIISEWLEKLLNSTYDSATDKHFQWIWFAIAVIVVLAGLFILYKNRNWFLRNKKTDDVLDYEVEEDNIYGVDFDDEIAKARLAGDWGAVVRLIYLSTLCNLNDNGDIAWQPFKTPSQYALEFRNQDFRKLTDTYIRVRYGGRKATEQMCDNLQSMKEGILSTSKALQKEGGENES